MRILSRSFSCTTMLFSTFKTKGGLRSDSLGDSSKITPSIWETRWPAAETGEKNNRMAGGKNKAWGREGEDGDTQDNDKKAQVTQRLYPLRVLPAHPRSLVRSASLAHDPPPKQGRGCRWEDRPHSILPDLTCLQLGRILPYGGQR